LRTRTLILLASLALAPATAFTEPEQLTGKVMNERLPGATIEIDTPIGTKIPMRFGGDGLVTGEAGVLAAYLGSAKDRGRWWVASDRLCIKWFRWFDSQPRCMDIKIDGSKVFWRKEDGESGTATLAGASPKVAEKKPEPAPKTEARAVAKSPLPQPQLNPTATTIAPPASPPLEAAPPAAAAQAAPPVVPIIVNEAAPVAEAPVEGETPAVSEASAHDQQSTPSQVPAPALPPSALGAPPLEVAQDLAAKMASPPTAAVQPLPSAPPAADVEPLPAKNVTAQQSSPLPPVTKARPSDSVAAKPVKRFKPAAKAAAKDLPGSFRVARVEDDDMLNVRSGPSEGHKAIGVIAARGRGVKITGACQGDWCPIRHGGLTGWVNRYYLAEEHGGSP
jgi:hypothetical protein